MKRNTKPFITLLFAVLLFFGASSLFEMSAWARAGGGGSSGSRGGRSFSSPSMPSSPSTGSPGTSMSRSGSSRMDSPGQPSSGFLGRSPFLQGMAGGLAGGLLGSMLFGGVSHAAPGVGTGGGMGLLDFAIIGLLLYLAWRFFKKRRAQAAGAGDYAPSEYSALKDSYSQPQTAYGESQSDSTPSRREMERGLEQIRQSDPAFNEEALKENIQDIFFRIQAAWMNRSIEDMMPLLTPEMAEFFAREMEMLKQKGVINRLENIAIRKVEPTEAWQEAGKDYITVLFTANLLDYTLDEKTGEVISGDKLRPVKFQEFWTFSRRTGSSDWELSAVNQVQG